MRNYLLLLIAIISTATSRAQYISTIAGGNGVGDSTIQFDEPRCFGFDSAGYLYDADQINNRVMKFPPGSRSGTPGEMIVAGTSANFRQVLFPGAIFVMADGTFYVADRALNRILKFPPGADSTTRGMVVAGGAGAGGSSGNALNEPVSIFVTADGSMYVSDLGNNRIQKFPPGSDSTTAATTVAGGNGPGSDPTQLNNPDWIWIDDAGDLYVSDNFNHRIQKFPANSTRFTSGVTVAGGNGSGSAPDQLINPIGLCVDHDGTIYVTDANNNRVQRFTPGNTLAVTVAGGRGFGTGATQLGSPSGLLLRDGDLYIADQGNNRIQKWGQITGETDVMQDAAISLYPDPNDGSFILTTSGHKGRELLIYDIAGRTVYQQSIYDEHQAIDITGMAAGTYALRVTGSDKTLRFVIHP